MDALVLVNVGEELHLHGAGVSAPVRGARRVESAAADGGGREQVEVYFSGLPGATRAARAALERMLARPDTRLRLVPYPGAETLEARLAQASCATLARNSGDGASAVRLDLLRAEDWQGSEVELGLSNPGGENVSGGLAIYGHSDSGHWNYADVSAASLAGDRPGALRLEVENTSATDSVGDVLLCLDAGDDPLRPGRLLEGEDASGGTRVTPAGCSGGAARQVEATGTGGALLSWAMEPDLLGWLGGREARPTARLSTPPPAGKVWAWWQVRSAGSLLWASPPDLLTGETLQELASLPLPPLPLLNPAGLALELCGKTASGTAMFSLDFVHLSPLDGWRRYHAAGALLPGGFLVDDGPAGRVYARTAQGAVSLYAAAGAPVRLHPGRDQRLYLLHGGGVDVPLRVRVWYRPAWGSA